VQADLVPMDVGILESDSSESHEVYLLNAREGSMSALVSNPAPIFG
jgi:hypothetical protein